MWTTLRSDLTEFVSTVADDTSNVLSNIDSKLTDAEKHAAEEEGDQKEGEEAQANVSTDSSMVIGEDGDVAFTKSGFEKTGIVSSAADEASRRMNHEETYTAPLEMEDDEEYMAQLKEYLDTFSIDGKTEEIAKLLEENPGTLHVQFEALVPTQVSYEDFWQRYFFRCDAERIAKYWEEEQEQARQARAKAISDSVKGVKNLFGGAISAVSHALEAGNESADKSAAPASQYQYAPQQQPAPSASSGIGSALFGAGGRPPFVMNTAVDEDDDDEEEEEEEELGWDDDDDEDYEELEDDEDEEEEQIEFSGAMEELQKELSQVTEERDQLHQTVEMQTKAIAELQLNKDSSAGGEDNTEEIEKLKMALFEKDSELAALKASLEDTHDADRESAAKKDAAKIASHERELERLGNELSTKQTELTESQVVLEKTMAEMDQLRSQSQADNVVLEQLRSQSEADKAALLEAVAAKSELESQIASLKEALAKSEAEAESLLANMESSKGDAASQVLAAQQETAAAQGQVESLTGELQEVKGNLEFTSRRADHLDEQLKQAQEELKHKEEERAAKMQEQKPADAADESSPISSVSSGVKVPPVDAPTPGGTTEDDDDDWGDAWGDEDD